MESINTAIFTKFVCATENRLRLHTALSDAGLALSVVKGTNYTADEFAVALRDVVDTPFWLIQRKVFSLPKLMLLPALVAREVRQQRTIRKDTILIEFYFSARCPALPSRHIAREPRRAAAAVPLVVLIDSLKSYVVAGVTSRIEEFHLEVRDDLARTIVRIRGLNHSEVTEPIKCLLPDLEERRLVSTRTRVEAHDTANAGLIHALSAATFTQQQWAALTGRIQHVQLRITVYKSVRQFINWLYWQDVLRPSLEVGFAFLLQGGHVTMTDVHLFHRVVEDAVDMLLMRSRAEAELARVRSDVERLSQLSQALGGRESDQVSCAQDAAGIQLSLDYTRGASAVRIDPPMVWRPGSRLAVVGPNGAGKSTLFLLLATCGRNPAIKSDAGLSPAASFDAQIPSPSIKLNRMGMLAGPWDNHGKKGDAVVEVSQHIYCPLHATPIAWIKQRQQTEVDDATLAAQFVALAGDLNFQLEVSTLLEVHEDFCGTLSGGQRVKFELIRSVLVPSECPAVLLLDEIFGPLDPISKELVAAKLGAVCTSTIILTTYHEDRKTTNETSSPDDISSACGFADSSFFSGVIEFGGDTLRLHHCGLNTHDEDPSAAQECDVPADGN